MNAPEPDVSRTKLEPAPAGERFAAQLLAYDEALAAGEAPAATIQADLPQDCREGFVCLELLEQIRSHDVKGPAPRTSPLPEQRQDPDSRTPTKAVTGDTVADIHIPERVGRFEVVRLLGRGGCGLVFLARDPLLNRLLALKVPRPEILLTAEMRRRFIREGRAAGGLDHPNLVPVFEVGENGAVCFIASAYCPGPNLREWLRRRADPPPPHSAAKLIAALADAVHYMHGQGVLHRDLKPSNVLLVPLSPAPCPPSSVLEDFVPRITDFGLAKLLEGDVEEAPTRTGAIFGTPQYMSPEQAQGRNSDIGPHTDVYALGAIFYELLTGVVPIQGSSDLDIMSRVLVEEPRPICRLRPKVHRDLETICLKCLEKQSKRRYGSALELAQDLRRFLAGEPIQARPCSRLERSWRWCRLHPARAFLAALIGLLVLVVLPGWVSYRNSLAESEAKHKQMEQLAAQERRARQEAEENAQTQRYFGLVDKVRQRNARKPLGWTWAALADLTAAARLDIPARNLVDLRSEAADALAGVDLRERKVLGEAFTAYCLAFSPDGRYLAAGQDIASAFLWAPVRLIDINTGKTRHTLNYPPHLAQLPNGKRAADGAICLAFSNDGRYLAVGTRSGWVHCWDLRQDTPRPVSWQATAQRVHEIAFHAHRSELYTVSREDHALKLWNVGTGKQLAELVLAKYWPAGIALHPEGKLLAVSNGDLVSYFDASLKGQMRPNLESKKLPRLLCYARHGRFLAAETDTGILLLDADSGEEVRQFVIPGSEVAHRGYLQRLEFSPDGSLLFSSSESESDRRLRIWEVASGRLLVSQVLGQAGPLAFAVHPQGKLVATAAERRIVLHDLANGAVQWFRAHHPNKLERVCFSADGQALACGGKLRRATVRGISLSLWQTDSGRLLGTRTLSHLDGTFLGEPCALAFHPRQPLLAACGWSHDVSLFDLQGTLTRSFKGERPGLVGFDRSGNKLWAVLDEKTVHSWHCDSGNTASSWKHDSWKLHGRDQHFSLAAGDRWVLAGGRDGQIHLINAADGKRLSSWPGPEVPVRSLALAHDERWAAAGFQNGLVRIFSLPDGAVHANLLDHTDSVDSLAIDPRDKWLISGAREQRSHLYKLEEGRPRLFATLTFPAGPVRSLCFHPDGKQFALIVGPETAVRIWSLERLEKRLAEIGLR